MPTLKVRIRAARPPPLLRGGGGGSEFDARRGALMARAHAIGRDPAARRAYNAEVAALRRDILAASGGSLVRALARGW